MSMTETLPTLASGPQQRSRIGRPSLFQRRPERSTSSTWLQPQLSIGSFIVRMGKNIIWEAIGPARDAFEVLAPEIKEFLELSTEPIPCLISWSVYMMGQTTDTASPTIIFCGEMLKHRQDIRRKVKNSGILYRYPGFKTGHMPRPPDFDQLVPLAHGKLPVNINDVTVSAQLSARACGTRIFIKGSTPSGLKYNKRATVGGVIKVRDRFFYTTAGHPFSPDVDEDSDSVSFDGSDSDESEPTEAIDNINARLEDPDSSARMSSPRPSRNHSDLTSRLYRSASDHHEHTQSISSTLRYPPVRDSNFTRGPLLSPAQRNTVVYEHFAPPYQGLYEWSKFANANGMTPYGGPLIQEVPNEANLRVELLNDETSSLDYALIAVERSFHMKPNEIVRNHPYLPMIITCNHLATFQSSEEPILAITSRGAIPGLLRGTPTYVLTPRSTSFCEARFAKFDAPLEEGDSGSWVVHQKYGHLYGHIVAGSPQKGQAILIPFSAIFASIEAVMGSSPQLPMTLPNRIPVIRDLWNKESDSIRGQHSRFQGPRDIDPGTFCFPAAGSTHDSGIHITDGSSSASLRDDKTDPDNHNNTKKSTSFLCELPCEFPGCAVVFKGDDSLKWIKHTQDHFEGTLPSHFQCCKSILTWMKLSHNR